MELHQDFKEFIELLNVHGVDYLVIGGYAVNYHGYPRYTKDIEFWIWLTDENIEKLLCAIHKFGFASLGLEPNDFSNKKNIVQLGLEPYRIDILMDLEGLNFEACYKQKVRAEIDGVTVTFMSLDDLIKAKENAGRSQDIADSEQLKKINK